MKKYAEAGCILGGTDYGDVPANCRKLVEILEGWIDEFSIPRLSDYGITEADLERVAESSGLKNSPAELTTGDIRTILSRRL